MIVFVANNLSDSKKLTKRLLPETGYCECTIAQLMGKLACSNFDLIIIDTSDYIDDWLDVISIIKNKYQIPLVGIIGDATLNELKAGINSGVDDYIYKNVPDFQLQQQFSVVLEKYGKHHPDMERRSNTDRRKCPLREHETKTNTVKNAVFLQIDSRSKLVYVNNKELLLSPTEFELLTILYSDVGRVFPPQEIIKKLWPDKPDAVAADVQQYIFLLRKKISQLESTPIIKTIKGFGYKLDLVKKEANANLASFEL